MRRSRHRGANRSGIATVLLALAVVGCSGSPRDQAKKELDSLHSSAVSAQMVGERWMQGAVPDLFASKALQSFGKKMRKERKKIPSEKLPAAVESFLAARFDSTAVTTDSLLTLIDQGERGAAVSIVARLGTQARAADSVEGRIGAR